MAGKQTVRLDLLISALSGNIGGLTEASKGLLDVQQKANGLSGLLKQGFAIDISGRLVQGLMQIQQAMTGVINAGLAFNQSLETTTIGIAAILRQTDRAGNFSNFQEAFKASTTIVQQLKTAALESSASFEDLALTYQTTATQMFNAGIPIGKQIALMQLLGNAIKTQLGPMADSRQLMTETRALLEGNTMPGATLASSILASDKDKQAYEQAKQSGQLFEFLQERLKGVAEGTKAASESFGLLMSNIGDLKQQMFGLFTAPLFDALKAQAKSLTEYLQSGTIVNSLRPLATGIGEAAGAIASTFVSLLPVVTNFVGAFGPVFLAIGTGISAATGVIASGIDKVKRMFATPDFANRWKAAMDQVVEFSRPVMAAMGDILDAIVSMVTSGVSILPELIQAFTALAPVISVVAQTVAYAFQMVASFTAALAANKEMTKLAFTAVVALAAGFIALRTTSAIVALATYAASAVTAATASVATAGGLTILKASTLGLSIAVRTLTASIMANPIGFLVAGLTTVASFLITKFAVSNAEAEASVNSLGGSMDEAAKKAAEMEKKILDSLKPPPLATASNAVEERVKLAQSQAKRERDIAELNYQAIQKDETVSLAKRIAVTQQYWSTKHAMLRRDMELERQAIAAQMQKASVDEKATLQTRLESLNDSYAVESAKIDADFGQTLRNMTIEEENRIEKMGRALAIRDAELRRNRALIDGRYAEAEAIQRQIDLETETNKVMAERELDRSKFATAREYEAARSRAREAANASLLAKERADAQGYLTDLRNRLALTQAQNEAGEEGVQAIRQQLDEQEILIEAQKRSVATQGESLRVAQALIEATRVQAEFERRKRDIANQKAMVDARGAQAQTDAMRMQYDLSATPEQIDAANRVALSRQLAGVQEKIALEKRYQNLLRETGQVNSQEYANSIAQVETLNQQMMELQNNLRTVGDTAGKVAMAIREWALAFGTIGDQMARFATGSMTMVTQKVSQGIYQMIAAGKTFREVMFEVLDGIIQKFIEMATEFIAQRLVMLIWNQLFNNQMVAQDQAASAQSTAVWTPAALMKSIATMGLAAIIGFGIFAAIAGAAGAFAEGGLIPGPSSNRDNRIAAVATGEYVTRASSVAHYGPGLFEALNRQQIPRDQIYGALAGLSFSGVSASSGSRFADGGLVGSASAVRNQTPRASELVNNIQVVALERRNDFREFMQSAEGQRVTLRTVKRRGLELGIRS